MVIKAGLIERFNQDGIAGLRSPLAPLPPHTLPTDRKTLILDLKAEHPPLRVNQSATICYARTGRRPDEKTIKRVLADNPLPERTSRRFPLYHQIPNPAERRAVISRLHFEGWGKKAISE
jgi:hypothetical protein